MFSYTSLFGFFEAFVYLRTGNFWSCFAAHAFCNIMSLPRVFGRVGEGMGRAAVNHTHRNEQQGNVDVGDLADHLQAGTERQDLGTEWTVAYYILLCIGAICFKMLLFPLTDSDLALVAF